MPTFYAVSLREPRRSRSSLQSVMKIVRRFSILTLLLTFFLAASSLGAQNEEEKEALPPVKLGGPKVLKMDWKTRALSTADLNGDGRPDMAVINNNHARIDLLYHRLPGEEGEEKESSQYKRSINRWEPTLTDAPFRKEPLVTGIRMFDLALGDLNGDGRTDLAYTGSPDDLTVRYRDEEGTFKQKSVFDFSSSVSPKNGTLAITDVNGDGRTDLVALGKEQIFVYERNNEDRLERKREYGLISSKCSGLKVIDLNRDGQLDLVYTAPSGRYPLRLRPGLATGGFGPERMFDIEPPKQTVEPLTLPDLDTPVLAYLQAQTEMITLLRFHRDREKADAEEGVSSLESLSPHVYSTGRDMTNARYAIGDLDGNDRPDIVAVDPGTSEFLVYFQTGEGILSEPERFPGPNDVRSLAAVDVNRDGRTELLMVSRSEELLGVSRWQESGRMTYPEPVTVKGKPLAVAAVSLENDGTAVAVVQELKGKRSIRLLRPAGEGDAAWETMSQTPLEGLHMDPSALRSVDANRDGHEDLAVFIPGSPVRFFLQKNGLFHHASTEEDGAGGVLSDVEPSALHTGDLDGDGTDELFLAEHNYLRSIEVGAGGIRVLDQYNARSPDARITAGMVTDVDRDRTNDLLLLDERSGSLQLLQKNESGVYRFVEFTRFGSIDQVMTRVLDFDRDGTEDLFVFGKKQFWKIPVRRSEFTYEIHDTWKMDLEEVTPSRIATGDLNGDGTEDLLAADTTDSRVLGIYTRYETKEWRPSLIFKVFSSDPHYRGETGSGSEPKEMHVADVTGDGKHDLILLVHNRILIYPQK